MRKRQKDKSMSLKLIMGVFASIIIMLGYQGVRLVRISQQLDQQIKQTKKEIAIESKKLEALEIEYANINTLENVEKVARDKLGFVREDEIVFRIKP